MKVVGGWTAEELSQKAVGWESVIRSLHLKPTQEKTAIAVLNRFVTHGVQHGDRSLSSHDSSHRKWTSTFLTRKEMRRLCEYLDEQEVCDDRYFWYIVEWLVRNGWLKKADAMIDGHRNMGWAFDHLCYRWVTNAQTRIPQLWEQAERGWRSRADRAIRGREAGSVDGNRGVRTPRRDREGRRRPQGQAPRELPLLEVQTPRSQPSRHGRELRDSRLRRVVGRRP